MLTAATQKKMNALEKQLQNLLLQKDKTGREGKAGLNSNEVLTALANVLAENSWGLDVAGSMCDIDDAAGFLYVAAGVIKLKNSKKRPDFSYQEFLK
jgi:hypothetical protein